VANLDLNKKWIGTPTETLLELLYSISEKYEHLYSQDISQLWLTAAKKPHNFSAILDFLLERVVVGVASGPAATVVQVCV
jgi:hypothetical protein